MKLTVDASVFLSFFLQEDASPDSGRLLSLIVEEGWTMVVPILTVFEILQAYSRSNEHPSTLDEIHERIIELNQTQSLKILSLEASFLAYFSAHHQKFNLKTSDSIVALTALREDCPLITWDRALIHQTKPFMKAMTPTQFLAKLKS